MLVQGRNNKKKIFIFFLFNGIPLLKTVPKMAGCVSTTQCAINLDGAALTIKHEFPNILLSMIDVPTLVLTLLSNISKTHFDR